MPEFVSESFRRQEKPVYKKALTYGIGAITSSFIPPVNSRKAQLF